MAGLVLRNSIKLRKNHFRFLAIFSWDGHDDIEAIDRFKNFLQQLGEDDKGELENLKGIDWGTFQAYYITGARKIIAIGQVDSTSERKKNIWINPVSRLQTFTSFITLGSGIRAEVYPIMEGFEVAQAGIV